MNVAVGVTHCAGMIPWRLQRGCKVTSRAIINYRLPPARGGRSNLPRLSLETAAIFSLNKSE